MAIYNQQQLTSASVATYFTNVYGGISASAVRDLNTNWISSSALLSGSNTFNGNQLVVGDISASGNVYGANLTGSTIATGSFATTGSNTFYGNETFNVDPTQTFRVNWGNASSASMYTENSAGPNQTLNLNSASLYINRGGLFFPSGSFTSQVGDMQFNAFTSASFTIRTQYGGQAILRSNTDYTNPNLPYAYFQASPDGTIQVIGSGGSVNLSGSATLIQGVDFIPFSSSLNSRINSATGSTIATGSFATTGSNNFVGNQTITGSLYVSSSIQKDVIVEGQLWVSSSNLFASGAQTQPQVNVYGAVAGTTYGSNQAFTKIRPGTISMARGNTNLDLVPAGFNSYGPNLVNRLNSSVNAELGLVLGDGVNDNEIDFYVDASGSQFRDWDNTIQDYSAWMTLGPNDGITPPIPQMLRGLNVTGNISASGNIYAANITGSTINTGSFATTGSNTFTGQQIINANNAITISGSNGFGYGITLQGGQGINITGGGGPRLQFPNATWFNGNESDNMQFTGDTDNPLTRGLDFYLYGTGSRSISFRNNSGPGATMQFTSTSGSIQFTTNNNGIGMNAGGNISITGSQLSLQGFTFPNTDGTNGQVLTTNGSKVLSFTTVATGSTINTGSLMVTGSVSGNTLTFTKGDATTFSLQVATGSAGQTFVNPTLTTYSGSLILAANGQTSASFSNISASTSLPNLIFNANGGTIPAGTIMSASAYNLLVTPSTPLAGFNRYLNGTNNIMLSANAWPSYSSSMQFPVATTGNIFTANGTINMRGPVSSSAWNVSGNTSNAVINIGTTAANHAQGLISGITLTNNTMLQQLAIIANKSNIGFVPTIGNNLMVGGVTTLNIASSSISYGTNIGNSNITNGFNNASAASGSVNNQLQVLSNLFLATPVISVSGSDSGGANNPRVIYGNLIQQYGYTDSGEAINLNLNGSGSSMVNTMVFGLGNIVTGSNAVDTNNGTSPKAGSAFFGRWNANDGVRNKTAETIFSVGTGTSNTNRKTGFLIDSGSNTFVEGTLNVSGSSTFTGSVIVSSSAAVDLTVIGQESIYGTQYISGALQQVYDGTTPYPITAGSLSLGYNATTQLANRVWIKGGNSSDSPTGRLVLTGTDGRQQTLGGSFQTIDTTATTGLGANYLAYTDTGSAANLNLAVFDRNNGNGDTEININVDITGTQFQDWDRNIGDYSNWLTIAPNDGVTIPRPVLTRGLESPGYVVLSQVSSSLNFANDTAAASGGVPLGGLYRNGNFIMIRLT